MLLKKMGWMVWMDGRRREGLLLKIG